MGCRIIRQAMILPAAKGELGLQEEILALTTPRSTMAATAWPTPAS